MNSKILIILSFSTLLCIISCKEVTNEKSKDTTDQTGSFDKEKAAILETLHDETEAAFQRNYDKWKEYWVHDPNITKTYINFVDSSFSESVGWDNISNFVKTFIEKHPKPEPVPKLVDDIDVRLYKNGAWVSFEQQDSLRGLKRETRLMEKVNGQWKIAGMQTTIYGLNKNK
ncbi:MAG: hypothetical protein KA713_00755 [Chryseotalea sp. WA131a]|nr:MAG: hypothetical protein KA713_00755 [Chryseotalea sp. WA131a]